MVVLEMPAKKRAMDAARVDDEKDSLTSVKVYKPDLEMLKQAANLMNLSVADMIRSPEIQAFFENLTIHHAARIQRETEQRRLKK